MTEWLSTAATLPKQEQIEWGWHTACIWMG